MTRLCLFTNLHLLDQRHPPAFSTFSNEGFGQLVSQSVKFKSKTPLTTIPPIYLSIYHKPPQAATTTPNATVTTKLISAPALPAAAPVNSAETEDVAVAVVAAVIFAEYTDAYVAFDAALDAAAFTAALDDSAREISDT